MKKEHFFWVFLIAFSMLLTLLCAEIGYRLIFRTDNAYSVAPTGSAFKFFRFDPKLGWSNNPGVSGTFERDEFRFPISINQFGLRQAAVSKQKSSSIFRIAVLGDSFVWGIGVPDEQRLTEQLQMNLPGTEVLNFGVSGYSPVQYFLMLDDVLEFAPDLVVIVFCLGNDYGDNVYFMPYGYPKPYAGIDKKGGLIIEGYELPDINEFGVKSLTTVLGSRILAAIYNTVVKSTLQQAGLVGFKNEMLYQNDASLSQEELALKQQAIKINGLILDAIQQKLEHNKIPFILTDAPTKREYNQDDKNGHQAYFPIVETILEQSAKERGITFIGNVHILHGDDFWEKDGHWNPVGHNKMAKNIADYISANRYLQPK